MKTKYKYKYKLVWITFTNLWMHSERHNRANIMIIGIKRWYASPHDYKWQISFFGLEVNMWFERTLIEP